MGVKNLLSLLEPAVSNVAPHHAVPVDASIGVDASAFIHTLLIRHMAPIYCDKDWSLFDRDVRGTLDTFQSWGEGTVKVKVVFDGHRLKAKLANGERQASRLAACKAVDDALEKHETLITNDLSKAVGSKAGEAALRVREVCNKLSIPWVVAPTEAEHQLASLQREGLIDIIACNDSDYIILRCKHILFSSPTGGLWTRECRYFEGPDALLEESVLEMLNESLARALRKWGFDALRTYALFATNDYANIKGVGQQKALHALDNATDASSVDDMFVSMGEHLAESQSVTVDEVVKAAEKARIMWQCSIVYNEASQCFQRLGQLENLLRHSEEEVSLMLGDTDSCLRSVFDQELYYLGGYDTQTLSLLESQSVMDIAQPSAPTSSAMPSDEDIDSWSVNQLKEFLKKHGEPRSGKKAILKKAALAFAQSRRKRDGHATLLTHTEKLEVQVRTAAIYALIERDGWTTLARQTDGGTDMPLENIDMVGACTDLVPLGKHAAVPS